MSPIRACLEAKNIIEDSRVKFPILSYLKAPPILSDILTPKRPLNH
jgi:hypothetical protein